jgi:spermidine/putrescine-binding protein
MVYRYSFRIAAVIIVMALFVGIAQYLPFLVVNRPLKSLCVYTWQDKIDEQVFIDFAQKTGIKIYVNYYDSCEELFAKLDIAQEPDADVIIVPALILTDLIRAQLIQKLDHDRLDFIHRIYPELLHIMYDPENEYTMPLLWDFSVLGYSKSYFPQGLQDPTWGMIFDKDQVPCPKISMLDDAREAMCLAMRYVNISLHEKPSQEDYEKIVQLFKNQKPWVGVYTDYLQGYFLTAKTYPLVVSQRENVIKEMIDNPDIAFALPKEGSLLFIDNVALSAHCKPEREQWAYDLINYLFSKEIALHNTQEFAVLSSLKDVMEEAGPEYVGLPDVLPGQARFSDLQLFANHFTLKQITDMWVHVRSS